MILESKLALSIGIGGAILAVAEDPTTLVGQYTQLGLAGAALLLVWWIVARRDPEVAKINADAIREAARINAEAIGELKDAMASHADRTYDLLAKALECPVPRKRQDAP